MIHIFIYLLHHLNTGESRNHASIKKDGITHIINWSNTAKCNLFKDFEYLCVSGVLGESEMKTHLSDLDYAVEFIESARKAGGKVLVHCWYGLNRSVTNLVAYLMKYEGMNASDACDDGKMTVGHKKWARSIPHCEDISAAPLIPFVVSRTINVDVASEVGLIR